MVIHYIDEKMLNQLHSWMKEFGGAEEYTEKVYSWLKDLIKKKGEQKPAWSEDDELMRKEAISIIKQYDFNCRREGDKCFTADKVISWLETTNEKN
ncbi:MAG: hypothetical protein IKR52_08885 [Paludibacteraceae bacterium]|nr:hypothetical protein [Paludibacteraceae bacterium]